MFGSVLSLPRSARAVNEPSRLPSMRPIRCNADLVAATVSVPFHAEAHLADLDLADLLHECLVWRMAESGDADKGPM
jgi:hypothetical protein